MSFLNILMVESKITWAIGHNDTTCSNINKMIDIVLSDFIIVMLAKKGIFKDCLYPLYIVIVFSI